MNSPLNIALLSGDETIDFRIDIKTGEAYTFKCNPRFWRTVTATMWRGMNFPDTMIKITLGHKFTEVEALGDYLLTGQNIKNIFKKP